MREQGQAARMHVLFSETLMINDEFGGSERLSWLGVGNNASRRGLP